MALTTAEQDKLKIMVAERDKQDAIDLINKDAYTAIQAKKDEIQALEDKRIADIKALEK